MSRLYDKSIALTFARYVKDSYFQTRPAIIVADLRVSFSITMTIGKKPNTGSISIWNLSQESRSVFDQKPVFVRLDAGYDGETPKLFQGDVTFATSTKQGVDWVTTLQVGDGNRAIRFARINKSYKSGVGANVVLSDIVASMGLSVPTGIRLQSVFKNGLALVGPAQVQLTRLLEREGLSWSVQGGQLQILGDRGVRKDQAIVVSEDTGLKGTPEYGSPTRKKGPPTVLVTTALDNGIVPGVKIQIESSRISGLYRVERVDHDGDTHSNSWDTKVQATPLK